MQTSNYPQPIMVRLLQLDDRAAALAAKADEAESAAEHARNVLSGKLHPAKMTPANFGRLQANFPELMRAATVARAAADCQQKLL
jgi:hypothetical protein